MYTVLVWCNNGVYGEFGSVDFTVNSREEAIDEIGDFLADGEAIYDWDMWEEGNPFDE